MKNIELTREFIKKALRYHNLSLTWLANILKQKGVDVQKEKLSQILLGQIQNEETDMIVKKAYVIINDYLDWFDKEVE